MNAPEGTVVAFSGTAVNSMAWNALTIGNTATRLGGVLTGMAPHTEALDALALAGRRLADDAAGLSDILAQLARDVESLRRSYR